MRFRWPWHIGVLSTICLVVSTTAAHAQIGVAVRPLDRTTGGDWRNAYGQCLQIIPDADPKKVENPVGPLPYSTNPDQYVDLAGTPAVCVNGPLHDQGLADFRVFRNASGVQATAFAWRYCDTAAGDPGLNPDGSTPDECLGAVPTQFYLRPGVAQFNSCIGDFKNGTFDNDDFSTDPMTHELILRPTGSSAVVSYYFFNGDAECRKLAWTLMINGVPVMASIPGVNELVDLAGGLYLVFDLTNLPIQEETRIRLDVLDAPDDFQRGSPTDGVCAQSGGLTGLGSRYADGNSVIASVYVGGGACGPLPQPGIDIRKQAEGPDTRAVASGSSVPFTIVVTNTGQVDLVNVQVTDPLVPACAQTIPSLPIGSSQTISCTANNVTAGFTNTACAQASAFGATASDCDDSTVTVAPGSLGNFVWVDKNANGVQDAGETEGVAGATAQLYACSADAPTAPVNGVGIQTIGANGLYLFSNLSPGSYAVKFTLPAGYIASPANAGGDDARDSDNVGGFSPCVVVGSDSNTSVDAGAYKPASLGDFVWRDLNSNGIQDGEPGIGGVTVTLTDCNGNPVTNVNGQPVGPQQTTAAGAYLFSNLKPGCYKVTFATPAGLVPSPANVGDDAKDSDAGAGGMTGNYTLNSGDNNLTVDAGFTAAICVPTVVGLRAGTSSGITGPAGNTRMFNANSVRASAWGRNRNSGAWSKAWLGSFTPGLGVTDISENGANNTHTVDNDGGSDNYVLFEFNQSVLVDKIELDSIVGDSDFTLWIGTVAGAFTNPQTLSDAYLTALGFTEINDSAISSGARMAEVNAGGRQGNVLIVAAKTGTDTLDKFKVASLVLSCPGAPSPVTLACPSSTGNVGTPYNSALMASGGAAPYTYSIVSGSLPNGLTLNTSTGAITGTPTASGTFAFTAKVVDATGSAAGTATSSCSIKVDPSEPDFCTAGTYSFTGSTSTSGTAGNVRSYTLGSNGLKVKVSAFSQDKSSGAFSTAYLGAYGNGLGVTNKGEGDGSNNHHVVDNSGQNHDYVVFNFNSDVVFDKAYLAYVLDDSDISVWIGDVHQDTITLSTPFLNGLTVKETNLGGPDDRWADINAGSAVGNILVIAPKVGDSVDGFKLNKLGIMCK